MTKKNNFLKNISFKKDKLIKKNTINLSIIDKEIKIDGSIISRGKLIIKGNIKGDIKGENIIIAKEGKVYSDASVVSMTVGGSFDGNLYASKELIILSTGTCSGTVKCNDLIVENGGILNAEVQCKISKNDKNQAKKKLTTLTPERIKKVEF
ncbi:MAG: hypothetical protein B6I26_07680 [Desulfobacteraceae bacterium 4572_130]|nr:MAG: hypothetical protein B6I26_07680 [Desulfobacteraceae bacterium 4572_130]